MTASPGALVRVEPPWSVDQVRSLNDFQQSAWHQFTCPNRRHRRDLPLVATQYGWACEGAGENHCDYAQNWAFGFMADGSWRQMQAAGLDIVDAYEQELGRGAPRDPAPDAATLTALAEGMTGRLLKWLPGTGGGAVLAYLAYDALFKAAGCVCRHTVGAAPVYTEDIMCPVHGAEHATPPPARTAQGTVLTDDVLAALADEAERGYDPDQLTERRHVHRPKIVEAEGDHPVRPDLEE